MVITLKDRQIVFHTEKDIPEDEKEKFNNWITEMGENLPISKHNTSYYITKDNDMIEIIFTIEKY